MADLPFRWVSALLHSISGASGACRFQPTCSEYAATALAHHGIFAGTGLSLWRLLRCQPFARGGFDPVPGTYNSGNAAAADGSSARTDDPLHLP